MVSDNHGFRCFRARALSRAPGTGTDMNRPPLIEITGTHGYPKPWLSWQIYPKTVIEKQGFSVSEWIYPDNHGFG